MGIHKNYGDWGGGGGGGGGGGRAPPRAVERPTESC
jgi:hypothetical protein